MATVDEKLDKILTGIGEVKVWQASYQAKFEAHEIVTEDHHRTLYGNGTPGLKTRMEKIENEHNTFKTQCQNQSMGKKVLYGVIQTVSAAFIVGMAVWLLGIFKIH